MKGVSALEIPLYSLSGASPQPASSAKLDMRVGVLRAFSTHLTSCTAIYGVELSSRSFTVQDDHKYWFLSSVLRDHGVRWKLLVPRHSTA